MYGIGMKGMDRGKTVWKKEKDRFDVCTHTTVHMMYWQIKGRGVKYVCRLECRDLKLFENSSCRQDPVFE